MYFYRVKSWRTLLLPLGWLYGSIMAIRNSLFNKGLLRSRSFRVPIICIGNLCTGGTGKTPHTEYLVRLLSQGYLTATLSRGYGRKTKGFRLATSDSTHQQIGDEPLQFARKFPNLLVAVDEKRVRGIRSLMAQPISPELILLDDAMQHRWVDPGLTIMLTDYYNLFTRDHILPAGNLREFRSGYKRAQIIVITKSPKILSPLDRKMIMEELSPANYQHVFFSYIAYSKLRPVFSHIPEFVAKEYDPTIFLVTGIANPYPLLEHISRSAASVTHIEFPDHHDYTLEDVLNIGKRFREYPGSNKIVVTTEKDMMRFEQEELKAELGKLPIYYISIEVCFHDNNNESFNQIILNYVRKNKTNH
jgi:tetraacyldisaccharide 4'-kinase